MTRSAKLSIALILGAVVVLIGVAAFTRGDDDPPAPESGSAREDVLVRPDSQRLTEGPDATFVEFLDFECEACGALYPTIEDLKETYGDRVTFVVRYMPLHASSVNAAKAAEAAAAQGQFEAMYDLLFQRQAEWGEQQEAEEARFFAYAEELGLDMDQFRADFEDPATLERIEQSEADGRSLGVDSTPTLFLDGELLEPETVEDLISALDAAVE